MTTSQGLTVRDKVLHIDKGEVKIALARQAELLGVSRSSLYYEARPEDPKDLDLMDRIDKFYTDYPFYGSRKMARELAIQTKERVNRKRVQRLMRTMGIEAIFPKKNLSASGKGHKTFPYLIGSLAIARPNQVWGTDITYIRVAKGFLYLTAIMDWHSRFVLSWELSNTLDNWFCLEAARKATENFGLPEITNSDQGVQYTSSDYINFWQTRNVSISMDGRGRAMDNIFTERLWRSVKYEEIYLKSYQSGDEARENLSKYFEFYNHRRLHQTLGYLTPAQVYFERG